MAEEDRTYRVRLSRTVMDVETVGGDLLALLPYPEAPEVAAYGVRLEVWRQIAAVPRWWERRAVVVEVGRSALEYLREQARYMESCEEQPGWSRAGAALARQIADIEREEVGA